MDSQGRKGTASSSSSSLSHREHYLVAHIRKIGSELLQYFGYILIADELQALEALVKLADDDAATILVFARLLQRKRPWAWSESLFKGVDTGHSLGTRSRVLATLTTSSIFEELKKNSPFDMAWEAVVDCFTSDNLSALLHRLKLPKTGDMTTKLNVLYNSLMTVRTLRGFLKNEFADHAVKCAFESRVQRTDLSYPVLVRINPSILHLYRRALRLLHIYSNMEASSAYSTPSVNFPLMVAINRIKFPMFDMKIEIPLFSSRNSFQQWENSHELKILLSKSKGIDEIKAQDLGVVHSFSLCKRVDEFILRLKNAIQYFGGATLLTQIDRAFNLATEGVASYFMVTLLSISLCLSDYLKSMPLEIHRPSFYSQVDAGLSSM